MIVSINGNEANVQHRVGVGQYAFELLRQFSQLQTSDLKFQIYLERVPLADMPKMDYKVFGPRKLWTLTGLQKEILLRPPDVLFTPTHYTPLFLRVPSVISIMDLAFERFPEYFKPRDLYQLKYWTRVSARQAKRIITISESTKQDIMRYYHVPADKIVVTHLGYDSDRFNAKVKKYRNDKYFLFLGTLQPRKNIVRLIEAFSQITDKKIKLVIVGMVNEGRGGWMNQNIFEKVKELDLDKRVEFTGYLPDGKIPGLMKGAEACVLPSLYEGFGLPAVEAMAVGTPVVVSRVSSLPEICGEAAIYIEDPYDVGSIKQGLEEILQMKAAELVKRTKVGRQWVKRYNWEDTAKKTLEILYEVAKR